MIKYTLLEIGANSILQHTHTHCMSQILEKSYFRFLNIHIQSRFHHSTNTSSLYKPRSRTKWRLLWQAFGIYRAAFRSAFHKLISHHVALIKAASGPVLDKCSLLWQAFGIYRAAFWDKLASHCVAFIKAASGSVLDIQMQLIMTSLWYLPGLHFGISLPPIVWHSPRLFLTLYLTWICRLLWQSFGINPAKFREALVSHHRAVNTLNTRHCHSTTVGSL